MGKTSNMAGGFAGEGVRPMSHRPKNSNKSLQRRMRAYGLHQRAATLALRATLRALSDELLAGRPVNLHKFGTFFFQKRHGRTHTSSKNLNFPRVQPDSWCLKFKVSPILRQQLKTNNVIPIYGRLPKKPAQPRRA